MGPIVCAKGWGQSHDPQETCNSRESSAAWTTLCNLQHVRHFAKSHLLDFVGQKLSSRLIDRSHPDVQESRPVKLEDVTDVLSECGRLKPFPPRARRHGY